jgi:eukaryotic translation initiation factor 2C
MVKERLLAYYDYAVTLINGTTIPRRALPSKIIYYRDGVSEGQFSKVFKQEVAAIRRAYQAIKTSKKAKTDLQLTTIVVTKRHHTRFYPISESDMEGKGKNCKPGTLVDQTVTSPYFKEFFLQSHAGLVGTARPAHYFVIQDDMNWDVGKLASFVSIPLSHSLCHIQLINPQTHQLCYTYVRATCGVSYSPAAYYADRLCERDRVYLQKFLNGDSDLRTKLADLKKTEEKRRKQIREAIYKPIKQ